MNKRSEHKLLVHYLECFEAAEIQYFIAKQRLHAMSGLSFEAKLAAIHNQTKGSEDMDYYARLISEDFDIKYRHVQEYIDFLYELREISWTENC